MERERAFNKYKSEFNNNSCNIFEVLYNKLATDIEITKQVLGEYFFEKYVLAINDNLENIEATVTDSIDLIYCENEIEYGSFFHFKPLLEKRINELIGPQQPGAVKDKKELYNHIFIGNAFEVFEKYHSTKSLAENSKTDLNLLFQLFENDNLFVETVELKHYINWLNGKYKYSLTELKKVDMKSKPNIQRTNDYNEYKRTTLKQP